MEREKCLAWAESWGKPGRLRTNSAASLGPGPLGGPRSAAGGQDTAVEVVLAAVEGATRGVLAATRGVLAATRGVC